MRATANSDWTQDRPPHEVSRQALRAVLNGTGDRRQSRLSAPVSAERCLRSIYCDNVRTGSASHQQLASQFRLG